VGLQADKQPVQLQRVKGLLQLESGTMYVDGRDFTICFDLPKGKSTLAFNYEAD
jgi:hypothetical protein